MDVAKALDPLKPRDFLVLVNRIAASLHDVSHEAEADALRRSLERLPAEFTSQ